jgi:hypothetical protein
VIDSPLWYALWLVDAAVPGPIRENERGRASLKAAILDELSIVVGSLEGCARAQKEIEK